MNVTSRCQKIPSSGWCLLFLVVNSHSIIQPRIIPCFVQHWNPFCVSNYFLIFFETSPIKNPSPQSRPSLFFRTISWNVNKYRIYHKHLTEPIPAISWPTNVPVALWGHYMTPTQTMHCVFVIGKSPKNMWKIKSLKFPVRLLLVQCFSQNGYPGSPRL